MKRLGFLSLLLSTVWIGSLGAKDMPGFQKLGIATVHPLATDAGIKAYRTGGNAIDAAIAAALTLGVVDGHNSGIGGGCFIVIHSADGRVTAIDGRETAPAKAHRDMYKIDGNLDEDASKTGALASGVPGALAAYQVALQKFGKKSLAELILPAAEIAEKGFPIDGTYAKKLDSVKEDLQKFEGSSKILLKPDGSPYRKGEVLIQTDLAKSYRAIAKSGISWFYQGDFAKQLSQWMASNGGIITHEDMVNYRVLEREPVRSTYRNVELVTMPPPSSGGIHVAQILNLLEGFSLKELQNDPFRIHVTTEAMRFAFADRAHWLGDPDFVRVPKGLTSKEYTQSLLKRLDRTKRSEIPSFAYPPRWEDDIYGKHTTHLSVADHEGNWIAITQTINTAFGSKVIVPGTGIVLNNEMDDFSLQPGVPNAFKLVGAEANAIAPGKRPLSSMSPTLVLRDGKPFMSVGAAGGPTIITQTLLAISQVVDFNQTPETALAAPRFHHQWAPEELKIESNFSESTREALKAKGHKLDVSASFGACQMVLFRNGQLYPAHDPRIEGKASGL